MSWHPAKLFERVYIIIIIWNHASKHRENISKYKLPCMKKKRNRLKRRRCPMFDNNRSPTGYDLFIFF